MTIPRCLFMQPGSIGRTSSTSRTYIQNNFYGGSGSYKNVWSDYGNRVCMRPKYYYPNRGCCRPFMSYMPHWVQNAYERMIAFNFLQRIINPTAAQDMTAQYQDLYAQQLATQNQQLLQQQQLLAGNSQATQTVGSALTDQLAQFDSTNIQA